jgi:hypothetical protein
MLVQIYKGGGNLEETLNIHEALKILKRHYITDNVQMVSRYIREGRLYGERTTRKDGWRIKEFDLYQFIDEEKPGIVEMVYVYDRHLESLNVPSAKRYLEQEKTNSNQRNEILPEILKVTNDTPTERVKENDDIDNPSISNSKTGTTEERPGINILKEIESIKNEISKISAALNKKHESLLKKQATPSKPSKKVTYEKMIFDDFKRLLIQWKKVQQNEVDANEQYIKKVYDLFYDEKGKMKQEIIIDNGFKCPITNESRQRFLHLLKGKFKIFLEKAQNNALIIEDKNQEKTLNESESSND